MNTQVFDNLEALALTADHRWARLASAIVYKNRIVSYGVNRQKSHTFQARFARNPHAIYLHSEISAIHNALKRGFDPEDFRRSCLYICRVKHDEKDIRKLIRALAKPCEGCFKAICEFDIKHVFYTDDNGDYITL